MEDKCYFVSSRGLLKSCDIYNSKISSSDIHLDIDKYVSIKKNDIALNSGYMMERVESRL